MSSVRHEIFLIGFCKPELTGSKLPSKEDCLKVLFYNTRIKKLNIEESARLVIKQCTSFWKRARIPVQESHRAAKKLIDLHKEWCNLVKNKTKHTLFHKTLREEWSDGLPDLFDIAHKNAMDMIGIEEDKQFLIKQRLKGREGCMMGVDVNLDQKEQRVLKRKQRAETRNNVYQEQPSTSTGKIILIVD